VRGKSISLHGALSPSGLLRLGSLLELPSMEFDKSDETVDSENPMLYATQNHFKAVNKMLDDLLAKKIDTKSYSQLGTWVGIYAKRIDRLPLLNVDAEMQEYSAGVADDLRTIAQSIKGSRIRTGMQISGLSSEPVALSTYDGYYGNREVAAERRSIRAQERGTSELDAGKIADQIRADTSKIRRIMTDRYKVEF
jgi:hypothetical protein